MLRKNLHTHTHTCTQVQEGDGREIPVCESVEQNPSRGKGAHILAVPEFRITANSNDRCVNPAAPAAALWEAPEAPSLCRHPPAA